MVHQWYYQQKDNYISIKNRHLNFTETKKTKVIG